MARKIATSPPKKPSDAPPQETVAITSLAERYLDFWQRNLLAWSNDMAPPPQSGQNA